MRKPTSANSNASRCRVRGPRVAGPGRGTSTRRARALPGAAACCGPARQPCTRASPNRRPALAARVAAAPVLPKLARSGVCGGLVPGPAGQVLLAGGASGGAASGLVAACVLPVVHCLPPPSCAPVGWCASAAARRLESLSRGWARAGGAAVLFLSVFQCDLADSVSVTPYHVTSKPQWFCNLGRCDGLARPQRHHRQPCVAGSATAFAISASLNCITSLSSLNTITVTCSARTCARASGA